LLKKTQKIIRRKIKKDNIARWLCLEKRKFDFSNREIEKKRREQQKRRENKMKPRLFCLWRFYIIIFKFFVCLFKLKISIPTKNFKNPSSFLNLFIISSIK
jgi:hypothetical protein